MAASIEWLTLPRGGTAADEGPEVRRTSITGLWAGALVSNLFAVLLININCFSAEIPVYSRGELFITHARTLNAESTLSV